MRVITEQIRTSMDAGARHVLVGHAFVTPGGQPAENTSDSEKKLNAVGGAEQVNANQFAGFHYVALGHLHRAHAAGAKHIRYSGSILKYSLSEATHDKGYTVIHLQGDGEVQVEHRTLTPRRDMRQVIGTMDEIERHTENQDYVFVTLLDPEYVPNFVDRVRNVYPNVMSVERQKAREQFLQTVKSSGNRTEMSLSELFHNFFVDVMEVEPTEEAKALFEDVLQTIDKKAREE
jgi:exonuclease SbcD